MDDALDRAATLASEYLDDLDGVPVVRSGVESELKAGLDLELGEEGVDAVEVLEDLARAAASGLVKSAGPRYFGFVTGGALPAALGADWLTSAWDQNAFSFVSSPAASVIEGVAAGWIQNILGLPAQASTAFVTGCQMAHVTSLAAARHAVLDRSGWSVPDSGLFGAPRVRVLTGSQRHVTVDRAVRLLGMGDDSVVPMPVDGQGAVIGDEALPMIGDSDEPTIVVLQAGEVNTGAFDPFPELIAAAHESGAWVHIDGAFGLWARASQSFAHLADGIEAADSWAFDAHKWLNVPYDSGVAVVADRIAHRAAMVGSAAYLAPSEDRRDAYDWTPDASRRARGIPVYAALRALGRRGVADLVERCCRYAREIAAGLGGLGLEIVNDVVLNQVLVRSRNDDETTSILHRVQEGGEVWMGGTRWQGRPAIRISISGWATGDADVARTIAAFSRAIRPFGAEE